LQFWHLDRDRDTDRDRDRDRFRDREVDTDTDTDTEDTGTQVHRYTSAEAHKNIDEKILTGYIRHRKNTSTHKPTFKTKALARGHQQRGVWGEERGGHRANLFC